MGLGWNSKWNALDTLLPRSHETLQLLITAVILFSCHTDLSMKTPCQPNMPAQSVNNFVCMCVGNYCTMCFKCYEDNDYDSQMMQCSTCNHWVHAKCEGLTGEWQNVMARWFYLFIYLGNFILFYPSNTIIHFNMTFTYIMLSFWLSFQWHF